MGLLQAQAGLDIAGRPVSPEEAARLIEFYQAQLRAQAEEFGGAGFGPGVRQYAHGGPIIGPTALTSLRTGQTYAVAGEAGPESVVPGGGYRTANIYLMMDGRVMAEALGQPLVDELRLRTGIQF